MDFERVFTNYARYREYEILRCCGCSKRQAREEAGISRYFVSQIEAGEVTAMVNRPGSPQENSALSFLKTPNSQAEQRDAEQNLGPKLCLSIQQPWAWLIVHGFKDIENRSWPTEFRGRIYVHAHEEIDEAAIDFFELTFSRSRAVPKIGRSAPSANLKQIYRGAELGGIIGQVDIVDCVTQYLGRQPQPFVEYVDFLNESQALTAMIIRARNGFEHPVPPGRNSLTITNFESMTPMS